MWANNYKSCGQFTSRKIPIEPVLHDEALGVLQEDLLPGLLDRDALVLLHRHRDLKEKNMLGSIGGPMAKIHSRVAHKTTE